MAFKKSNYVSIVTTSKKIKEFQVPIISRGKDSDTKSIQEIPGI